MQERAEDAMDRDDLACPSYEFRFETAKLLVELDETTEDAVQVRFHTSLWRHDPPCRDTQIFILRVFWESPFM